MNAPIKPTFEERKQQLHIERCRKLCHKFLGCYLVRVSDEDVEAYETTDGGWLFTKTDEPIMSGPSIRKPTSQPIPGLFKWKVERAYLTCNYPTEPDDIDLAEIAGRFDSLEDALEKAVALQHRDEVSNFCESAFWEDQNVLEKEYTQEIHDCVHTP
jgi:hypothetical protein